VSRHQPRRLTAEERALWRQVVRAVAPLRPPEQQAAPPAPLSPVPPAPPPPPTPQRLPPPSGAALPPSRGAAPFTTRRLDPDRPVDLDRRSWRKLRRGQYPIDARLDLHGLTQAEAHARLASFLASAAARGNRCVLVITGRGLRHGGTLRSATPRWLDEPPLRGLVLSYAQASLQHGGEGALYVLLRRRGGV
jgi:DNA-nicking Smr family endonuclease